eukprot:3799896-Pleurochrysis_carterae.AAC.1
MANGSDACKNSTIASACGHACGGSGERAARAFPRALRALLNPHLFGLSLYISAPSRSESAALSLHPHATAMAVSAERSDGRKASIPDAC